MSKVKLALVFIALVLTFFLLSTETSMEHELSPSSIQDIHRFPTPPTLPDNDSISILDNKISDSMANMNVPGVYIEEIHSQNPIKSVELGVAGFLGQTEKGPVEPRLITSLNEFIQIYGESTSYLYYAVEGFFQNGGQKLYIARVVSKPNKSVKRNIGGKIIDKATLSATLQLSDYLGNNDLNAGPITGLSALGEIDEISILYSPDSQSVEGLTQAMIDQCESLKDRFLIIDSSFGEIDPEPSTQYQSSYAAYYYPWLQITDNETAEKKLVPPGGFVAGIFVSNDLTRGIHKAPANLPIVGIDGLEISLATSDLGNISFNRVNPIIKRPSLGILIYGARTLSLDDEYRYTANRRYLCHLWESITESLSWAAKEPWSISLQTKIKSSIENYLLSEWHNRVLMGNSEREAFFVSVQNVNILQDGSYQPVIYIEVGVALLKPAEFHIIKIAI